MHALITQLQNFHIGFQKLSQNSFLGSHESYGMELLKIGMHFDNSKTKVVDDK